MSLQVRFDCASRGKMSGVTSGIIPKLCLVGFLAAAVLMLQGVEA